MSVTIITEIETNFQAFDNISYTRHDKRGKKLDRMDRDRITN